MLPPGTGRFTTNPDPVWAQVLGARYGFTITPANQGGTDYAQGGARITLLPGVPEQSADGHRSAGRHADHAAHRRPASIPARCYALWGGANDIFVQLGLAQAGHDHARAGAGGGDPRRHAVRAAGRRAAGRRRAEPHRVQRFPTSARRRGAGGRCRGLGADHRHHGLYNNTVQAGLNSLGGNVLRVDIATLFNEILANPCAFGFTNATTPACGATPSLLCTPANLVAPNANQTFVFADGVHPTGAAHAVIAAFVASLIEAPFHAATLTEGPLAVEQATFRTVDARMWSALNTPIAQKGFNLWASYDYANPDVDFGRVVSGDADLHMFSHRRRPSHRRPPDGGRRGPLQRIQGELRRAETTSSRRLPRRSTPVTAADRGMSARRC